MMRVRDIAVACGLIALAACGDNIAGEPCPVQASGTACTWAGLKGEQGFNGDGHHRLATQLNQVQDLLFLPDGTAWFTDFNNYQVRKVRPDDTIESVVGWTDPPFPGDGPMGGIPAGGAAGVDWQLNHPTNLVLDPSGMVMLVAWHNHKIVRIDPETGFVRVVCGGGAGFAGDGGSATGALFRQDVYVMFPRVD
jgi:hypothetical protein